MAYNNKQKAAVKFYWYSVTKANDQSIDDYKTAFESYINAAGDDRDPNGIYFLPVTQEIYANGVYFGVDDTMFKGVQSTIGVQGVQGDTLWGHIKKLETTVGDQTQISEAIIKVLSEVALKLDGRNIANDPNGAQGLTVSLKTSYKDGSQVDPKNLTAAVNLLSTAVSEIQTSGLYDVSTNETPAAGKVVTNITKTTNGVQGILGTLNSTQITRTADAQNTLAGATVETALTGLQRKIDPAIKELAGTQSRIGAQYTEIKGWQHDLTEQVNSKISIGTNTNATGAFSTTPPNSLTDGNSIAQEIEDAVIKGVQRVIGSQGAEFWGQQGYTEDQQTLFNVANKLAAVASAVNTLSGGQGQNIADVIELINQIKTELSDPVENTSIKSVLDNLFPLISNAGYQSDPNLPIDGYQWSVNGTTQRNLKDIISALETEISGAQAGAQTGAQSYTDNNTVKQIKGENATGVQTIITGTPVGTDGYQRGDVGVQVFVDTNTLVASVQNSNNKVLNGESYTVNSALTTLDTGIGGVQTQVNGVQTQVEGIQTALQEQIDTGLKWTVIDSINQNSNQNP